MVDRHKTSGVATFKHQVVPYLECAQARLRARALWRATFKIQRSTRECNHVGLAHCALIDWTKVQLSEAHEPSTLRRYASRLLSGRRLLARFVGPVFSQLPGCGVPKPSRIC